MNDDVKSVEMTEKEHSLLCVLASVGGLIISATIAGNPELADMGVSHAARALGAQPGIAADMLRVCAKLQGLSVDDLPQRQDRWN